MAVETTEERLLAEAARLFREQGYAKTSTRELAAVLGIQSASLYHYIASKEDLLARICLRGYQVVTDAVERAARDAPPSDLLERAMKAHLDAAVAHRDLYLSAQAETRHLAAPARAEVQRARDRYSAVLGDVVTRAQTAGAIRSDIPADALVLILGNQLTGTVFWFEQTGPIPGDRFVGLVHDVLMNGLARPSQT